MMIDNNYTTDKKKRIVTFYLDFKCKFLNFYEKTAIL